MASGFWTHPSVLKFAGGSDPVEAVLGRARTIVLNAIEEGWAGPPFDPFELARLRKLEVIPREDVDEAQLVARGGRLEVNYNPMKPRTRVRYSVAHEVAHTIFTDCGEKVRFRNAPVPHRADDWQLETLCNLAAAEFLMPIGTFPEFDGARFGMEEVLKWRRDYGVSTEAMLLRLLHLGVQRLLIFSASTNDGKQFSINYALRREGAVQKMYGRPLRRDSPVASCTAIGYTEKGVTVLPSESAEFDIECVGVAPYPGEVFPRVIGFARPRNHSSVNTSRIKEVRGDALAPRGAGPKILAHLVNDKALSWGAGFGKLLASKYPAAASSFKGHIEQNGKFHLGEIFATEIDSNLTIVQLVAQHGYGDSKSPRLKYVALQESLEKLASFALKAGASIHMPRIGTGFGGGAWALVKELIDQEVCRRGPTVTVYSLQEMPQLHPTQATLF